MDLSFSLLILLLLHSKENQYINYLQILCNNTYIEYHRSTTASQVLSRKVLFLAEKWDRA